MSRRASEPGQACECFAHSVGSSWCVGGCSAVTGGLALTEHGCQVVCCEMHRPTTPTTLKACMQDGCLCVSPGFKALLCGARHTCRALHRATRNASRTPSVPHCQYWSGGVCGVLSGGTGQSSLTLPAAHHQCGSGAPQLRHTRSRAGGEFVLLPPPPQARGFNNSKVSQVFRCARARVVFACRSCAAACLFVRPVRPPARLTAQQTANACPHDFPPPAAGLVLLKQCSASTRTK